MTMELIKKQIIKRAKLASSLWRFRSNGLYCFNFHRIGDADLTPFDPCVYSCDANNFQLYLEFFKNNFRVINLDELYSIIKTGRPIKEKLALLTFDDGYSDNYEVAYPILKSMNIPATFFVTTSLVGSDIVPWWDEIAWHVKQLAGKKIKLSVWPDEMIIPEIVDKYVIRRVLSRIKTIPAKIDLQLKELRAISKTDVPKELANNLFMSWENLKELENNGISIGAHSHTHRILSSLSNKELIFELTESKRLLEDYLKTPIDSLSYPVGGESTYSTNMFKLLRELGYKVGFTFRSMVRLNIKKNNYELGRLSIDRAFNEQFLKEMILTTPKQ